VVGRARGRDGRSAPATDTLGEILAPQPTEGWRIRSLEYEAVQARAASKRASALRELRELGRQDSVTTMLVAVLDGNNDVRAEAARGIATLADTDAVEPLVHAVATRSRRADGARDAILGLGPIAIPELQRLERDSNDPETRRAAADLEHSLNETAESSASRPGSAQSHLHVIA
jgi:hypothetical protein